MPKRKANLAKYLNRSFFFFFGGLIIPAFSVQAWPYRYWFLAGYSWPRFISLILFSAHVHQKVCWKVPACRHISLHFCFLQLIKSHLQRMTGGRWWQYRKWGDTDMAVSRRGKGENVEAEPKLESECDRQRRGRWAERKGGRVGGRRAGGRGRDAKLSQSPPSSPGFSVKDTVLKRWITCALSAKACPRQWHHHHQN